MEMAVRGMMLRRILKQFVNQLEDTIDELQEQLDKRFDFAEIERMLSEQLDDLLSSLL